MLGMLNLSILAYVINKALKMNSTNIRTALEQLPGIRKNPLADD
jgi:hypothetical protein